MVPVVLEELVVVVDPGVVVGLVLELLLLLLDDELLELLCT
jgi:hypothetical protein